MKKKPNIKRISKDNLKKVKGGRFSQRDIAELEKIESANVTGALNINIVKQR